MKDFCYLCWLKTLSDRDLYFRYVDWSKAEHSSNCVNKYKKTKYQLVTRRLNWELLRSPDINSTV